MTSDVNSLRVSLALVASRVRAIGAGVCLVLWCSCTTFPNWDADDSIRPPLPAETSFEKAAGRGDLVCLKLRLERGGELLFALDTGAQVTLLDKSLEPKLGKRLGSVEDLLFGLQSRQRRSLSSAQVLSWQHPVANRRVDCNG